MVVVVFLLLLFERALESGHQSENNSSDSDVCNGVFLQIQRRKDASEMSHANPVRVLAKHFIAQRYGETKF